MILDENKIPVAENGQEVTGGMLASWDEAYSSGHLPEGYEYDGPSRPGRPKLFAGEMTSISVRVTKEQKEMLEENAKAHNMSLSGYIREALLTKSA